MFKRELDTVMLTVLAAKMLLLSPTARVGEAVVGCTMYIPAPPVVMRVSPDESALSAGNTVSEFLEYRFPKASAISVVAVLDTPTRYVAPPAYSWEVEAVGLTMTFYNTNIVIAENAIRKITMTETNITPKLTL